MNNLYNVKSKLERQALEAGFKKIDRIGEEFFQKLGKQFLVKVSFPDYEDTNSNCVYIKFEVTANNMDFHYVVWEAIDLDDAGSPSCFNKALADVFHEIAEELAGKAQAALMTSVTGTLQ